MKGRPKKPCPNRSPNLPVPDLQYQESRADAPWRVRESLHRYTATVLENLGCHAVLINSVGDHMHILFELARTVAVSAVVEDIKKASSQWLKTQPGNALRGTRSIRLTMKLPVPVQGSRITNWQIFACSTSNTGCVTIARAIETSSGRPRSGNC